MEGGATLAAPRNQDQASPLRTLADAPLTAVLFPAASRTARPVAVAEIKIVSGLLVPPTTSVVPCGFAAARGVSLNWIQRDIAAYQPIFPGISLPAAEYFNAGVVVLDAAQRPIIAKFLDIVTTRWRELQEIQQASPVGTDQTPLNFTVRLMCERVHVLPRPFNLLHCAPMVPSLLALERGEATNPTSFCDTVRRQPELFGFIDFGHVWHFTNVVVTRQLVMEEVFRKVSRYYPGIRVTVR
jgi:hypothetical protein